MRYTIPAGTYFGIPVLIHFTFPLVLIAFGAEAWSNGTWLDAVRAVLLIGAVFVCVVLHEFGHALQVKRYGITVRDIVLLPIGGMARAERIPEDPRQEIIVAISGPLVNFGLAAILFAFVWVRHGGMVADGFATNLLLINLVLGTFNLVPAFPMDGGRILRALLAMRMDYLRATRVARAVGQVIALGFVIIGFLNSAFLMLPVIAIFIFFGAMSEENMIRVRHALTGKVAADLIDSDTVLCHGEETAADVWRRLPDPPPVAIAIVDSEGTFCGAVETRAIAEALRKGSDHVSVGSLAVVRVPLLAPDTPAVEAYYLLKNGKMRFAVVGYRHDFRGLASFDRFLRIPS